MGGHQVHGSRDERGAAERFRNVPAPQPTTPPEQFSNSHDREQATATERELFSLSHCTVAAGCALMGDPVLSSLLLS
jgi:hypothetical protein